MYNSLARTHLLNMKYMRSMKTFDMLEKRVLKTELEIAWLNGVNAGRELKGE